MGALGTCFIASQSVLNRVVDAAVIAELEVQVGIVRAGAPIAAKQSITLGKGNGARHAGFALVCQVENRAMAECLTDGGEELLREIGRAPLAAGRVAVEAVHGFEVQRLNLAACMRIDAESAAGKLTALPTNFFALLLAQARQEGCKICEVSVGPVKLTAAASQERMGIEAPLLGFFQEERVTGGKVEAFRLAKNLAHEFMSAVRRAVGTGEEFWAGSRREGDGGNEFGVVGEARAFIGTGPGPVEDILSIAVEF